MQSLPENENLGILQSIEWAILSVYRSNRELTDYQVDAALEALGRTYQREKTGGQPVLPKSDMSRAVYDAVKNICEWQLGRTQVVDEDQQPLSVDPVPVEVIQSSLKRLRKSISLWNKEGGTRGYLSYISQFIP